MKDQGYDLETIIKEDNNATDEEWKAIIREAN